MNNVKLDAEIAKITKPWNPMELARVNDTVVRMALFEGEYNWHKHGNEDELLLVYKGKITIQFRERNIELKEGEFIVVPKGVEHCPKSHEKSYVLMFEPATLKSR